MVDQALQFFFTLIAQLIIQCIVWLQPFLPMICGAIAWALPIILFWNLFTLLRSGARHVRKLHRIPCANCQYATNDYHLKCSVRPVEAFSEQAIACSDFASNQPTGRSLSSTAGPAY